VDVKEAGEVELGERRLDLTGAHLINAIVEPLDVLKG
jgi:hypothetical protein